MANLGIRASLSSFDTAASTLFAQLFSYSCIRREKSVKLADSLKLKAASALAKARQVCKTGVEAYFWPEVYQASGLPFVSASVSDDLSSAMNIEHY